MQGLKGKIFLLILIPIFLILSSIGGLTIYNKIETEDQLMFDRISLFRVLLESGDLSFEASQDKAKLESLLHEKIILSEILRNDYSVVYSSENSANPLISEQEKVEVDEAFDGIETMKVMVVSGENALSIVTPLVINDRIIAVLHQILSREEYSLRVSQYSIFIIFLALTGLIVCYSLIHVLMNKLVLNNLFKLKQATDEIKKGKLDTKIDYTSNDEIGRLAESFNHMTKKLLESRRSIEKNVKELSVEHGKLASLVESIKLGVVMVDLSLNVILANSAAKKIFGKSPSTNITFKDLSAKLANSVDISQALSYYVHTGTALNVQEVSIDDRYFRLFMSPVRDIIEKIFIGAVAVIEDITEQKKIEKMRTEIVSITSHQLRTPSTIIKGNLEMVLGGDVGEINKDQKELLENIYLGNQRMIRLINDLMDVAKIDEGKFKVALESAQLENLVAEVVRTIKPLAKERKVSLLYNHPAIPFPSVKINCQRVSQVIQNIIDNAIKYSSANDEGKVTVDVQEGAKFLEFIVKDNGIGIPENEQDKIFERFSRGSNSTKLDPGGGSGLGLYIARAVVEQGGGRIWFESKEGEGTTFHATFPYN